MSYDRFDEETKTYRVIPKSEMKWWERFIVAPHMQWRHKHGRPVADHRNS
jgi:hypothetical protein